ncbi:hypothetical protein ES707_11151 [subsurface metagenome]
MAEEKRRGPGQMPGLVLGGVSGALAGFVAALLATRPARAAPPEAKIDYIIECQTAIVGLLEQIAESNARLVELLEQLQGLPPGEGIKAIQTRWQATEPEEIFHKEIRSAASFYTEPMVSWQQGKRLLIKVESSLNQNVQIQLMGNVVDNIQLATEINAPQPCAAGANISIGPAWDDWHPFIGVRVDAAVAPTSGVLIIWAVIQE